MVVKQIKETPLERDEVGRGRARPMESPEAHVSEMEDSGIKKVE